MNVGEVIAPGNFTMKPNLFCPTLETMAWAIIRVVGCSHREVIPYVWHVLAKVMLDVFGDGFAAKLMGTYMKYLDDEREVKDK